MCLKFYPVFIVYGLVFFSACTQKSGREETEKWESFPDTLSMEGQTYTGRLYSSGLQEAEAEKLGLSWPVFQITGRQSYFFSAADSLHAWLGSCLELRAREKWAPEVETIHEQFTYQRGGLELIRLELVSGDRCNDIGIENPRPLAVEELETFRGSLKRQERPAPDIAYDYTLLLEEPYLDENHPIEGRKVVEELPLFVSEASRLNLVEQALAEDKKVLVEGSREQAYAESTVLRVVNIIELPE